MAVRIVIGAQWGDEGKGKIVDLLSSDADFVVRYQGGANAGHTLKFDDTVVVLHLIPSGMFNGNSACIIGNGVVIDPIALMKEIKEVEAMGVNLKDRLFKAALPTLYCLTTRPWTGSKRRGAEMIQSVPQEEGSGQ